VERDDILLLMGVLSLLGAFAVLFLLLLEAIP
jgi:hypothetical protein